MTYSLCLTSTRKLAAMQGLAQWLGVERVRPLSPLMRLRSPADNTLVVGWGTKPNTRSTREFAARHGLAYWQLEDGFYCYRGHPSTDPHRLSLIIDQVGIYYDATRPSALENLLNRDDWVTSELLHRAERAIQLIVEYGFSKYNHYRSPKLSDSLIKKLESNSRQRILLIDQVAGDMSVELGLAGAGTFHTMVDAALRENPGADIFIKVHPDVIKKHRQGYLTQIENERITRIDEDCNPLALLERFDRIYTVTSQLGFEALLLGKSVTCFGMPFYAGWGLTDDRQSCLRRKARRTLPELFTAACLIYPHYQNPLTGRRCELEQVLEYFINTQICYKPVVKRLWCVGFTFWKRAFIDKFVKHRADKVYFVSSKRMLNCAANGDAVLSWGRKCEHLAHLLPEGVPLWRMEDGFLRSVGLGSDLCRPASLVLDESGIYYDPGKPSDLEILLHRYDFKASELARAKQLIHSLRGSRLSKYNVGGCKLPDLRTLANGRKLLLVPGQVEGDASLQFGSPIINTNACLLQIVRLENPEAFIVYKPHPDVASGNRRGTVDKKVLAATCNAIVTEVNIIDCLQVIDEVHTMTSLTGFEALLHGKSVVCYGQPFYSGWGLTIDRCPLSQRIRRRSIEELVAATLVCYPIYMGWPEGRLLTPEGVIDRIAREKSARVRKFSPHRAGAWWERKIKKLSYLMEAF